VFVGIGNPVVKLQHYNWELSL